MKILFVVVGIAFSFSHLQAFAEIKAGNLSKACKKYCPKEAKNEDDKRVHECVEKQHRLNKSVKKELDSPGNKCWEANEEFEKNAAGSRTEEQK